MIVNEKESADIIHAQTEQALFHIHEDDLGRLVIIVDKGVLSIDPRADNSIAITTRKYGSHKRPSSMPEHGPVVELAEMALDLAKQLHDLKRNAFIHAGVTGAPIRDVVSAYVDQKRRIEQAWREAEEM